MPNIPPTKEELEEVREKHTREQIADMYGVSVSQVKRWISNLGVKKKINRGGETREKVKPRRVEPSYDSGLPLMEKAKLRLGDRMVEKKDGYWLDGRPVSSNRIAEAAGLSIATR